MTHDALFQLGMDLEAFEPRSTAQTEENTLRPEAANANGHTVTGPLDHFIEDDDGTRHAGSHLIIDLYDAERLNDLEYIQSTMLECVEKAGATLLHIHLHPFEPNGVSGVAVLAESHISVHTWPEAGYAAFDVFMCGDAKPELCIDILAKAFNAGQTEVSNLRRGEQVAEMLAIKPAAA
ncbi:MAG: adenosylmethionine decarboxylase [Ahrensia sp.]